MTHASALAPPPGSSPLRGDEFEFRKVSAKSAGVAGQKRNFKGRRVAANQKIGQHVAPRSSGASIQFVGLRRAKGGLPRNVGVCQVELLNFAIAVGKRREADGEFRIDHRIEDALFAPSRAEGRARPACPVRVVRGDVDEDIRIDEYQISLRVICMTSSVV